MTIIEHLEELRTRLFIALGAWVVGSGVAFAFRGRLLDWLKEPLPSPDEVEVISTRLLEPFLVSMQTAAFAGLLLASPIVLAQVWGFISPGLYREERRWAVPFVLLSVIAFTSGTLFARYLVLPFALPILLGFLGTTVTTFLSIGDFISKMLLYMTVFGLLFEMPVLGFLLARIGDSQSPSAHPVPTPGHRRRRHPCRVDHSYRRPRELRPGSRPPGRALRGDRSRGTPFSTKGRP